MVISDMGEANRKAKRHAAFLRERPQCIYCGAAATTVEHCPARCIFVGRLWPETYEFPACQLCNDEGRLDEQAIAVLVRMKIEDPQNAIERDEWKRLGRGVFNNQPDLVREWQSTTRNDLRRVLRDTFGETGDQMRREGWGAAHMGPLTQAVLDRFMIRLSKALYYHHNKTIFEGVVYTRHISLLDRDATPEFFAHILSGAPTVADTKRGNRQLKDQFIYRFYNDPGLGVLYAVVQFSEQFVFQLIVLSWKMTQHLEELAALQGADIVDGLNRYEFRLSRPPKPT
jgi:hypothetical protein